MATIERANSERFLAIFNEIERFVRKLTKSGPQPSFQGLLSQAAGREPAIRRYIDDLRELADLRNAIVHQSRGEVIAEPHSTTCALIEKIARLLMDPPRVYPDFQREVIKVETNTSLAHVVAESYRLSFSQFPVTKDGRFVGVITTNTIVRWLGANASDDLFSLADSVVEDVLAYTEFTDNYEFVARDTDLLSVVELFRKHDESGHRLDATLISQSGRESEKMIGIITPWDLLELHSRLSLS